MICFVHIERTGGTTLHRVFVNNFPGYVRLKSWRFWSNAERNDFSRRECRYLKRLLPWVRVIGGHGLRSFLRYETILGEPVQYITFLREPVSRYLSHFRHQRDVMRIGWTLESFCAERLFDNYMTNHIAPDGDVETAKRALRDEFAFVGVLEDFDRSLVLMTERLGLEDFDTRYEICNANRRPRQKRDGELAAALHAKILENNALDLELYRFVKEDLFPSYVRATGDDLEDRVRRHLEASRGFRFSQSRQFLSSVYMKAMHRPVEKVLRNLYHTERKAA
jgi:hypothetical protein